MNPRFIARGRILLALAVGALTCVVPPTAVAAEPDRSFYGIQTWTLPNSADVQMMERARLGTLRIVLHGQLGASPSEAAWAPYDKLMTSTSKAGIEVLPVLLGIKSKSRRVQRPRTRSQRKAWYGFVTAVAKRYGRDGSFWKKNPMLAPKPFTAYQIWNEPNLPAYWRPSNDAKGYVKLVRGTRERLRKVDSAAQIVLAGLPDSRRGTPSLTYLRSIYAQRGSRSWFDVVALHPYSRDASGVLVALNRVRAHMNGQKDRKTPIWVTEVGWAASGPSSPFTTTKSGQSRRVAALYRMLTNARERLVLGRVLLFGLQDRAYGVKERPWWGPKVGMFDVYGRPKPAWRSLVRATGGESGDGRRLSSVTLRAQARHARKQAALGPVDRFPG